MTTTTRAEPAQESPHEREPVAPATRASQWFARIAARPRLVVAACASIAGVWGLAGSRALFPFLSNDHDEAVYLLQANALEHGHLFPRAPSNPDAFLPWLTVQEGHHYVPKYAPVFPAMLAIAKWLFTSERMALALIAAGVIVMTYLLATEILEDRRQAALASVFMLLTPLFIVQSATFLPYSTGLLLLASFAYLLLRGLRLGQARWLVLSGFVLGLAFFARPYDAIVFTLPLALYVLVRYRKEVSGLLKRVGWVTLGLIPPMIAVAAFNNAATGSSLSSPFSLIDSRDTIGFGERSMDPRNQAVRYTPGLGWTGLSRHVMLSAFWVFGGLVLIGCGLFFLSRQRWRGRPAWFGAIALALPVGYLFFWGTYGAAVWGAPWYLGPYYYMPIFAPLIILGTGGFVYFLREFGKVAKWTLVGMLLLSTFVTAQAMVKNWGYSQDDRRLNTALANADLHDALVFLPGFYGPRILHPFATARNNWNVSGDVIYAVNRTESENASVVTDFPSRKAYVVEIKGQYRDHPSFDTHLTSTLTELTLLRGKTVEIAVDFKNPVNRSIISVALTTMGKVDTYVIDKSARRGTRERLRVGITSTGVSATGARVMKHTTVPSDTATPDDLIVQIAAENKNGEMTALYFRRVGVARRGDAVSVLLPGQRVSTYRSEPLKFTAR
jgi:4-amino-4-deoxy-L-arabinose transferase-like glycosyltransferase